MSYLRITPEPWMVDARCAQIGGDIWFPDKDGSGDEGQSHAREAKAICRQCPVRAECLAYALEHDQPGQPFGIYGGVTARERRRMLREAS